MKRALIPFSFIFILAQTLFSQEKLDDAFLVCQYQHYYKIDTLENRLREDLWILQIGKDISKFYSYYTFQSDSLHSTAEGKQKGREILDQAFSDLKKNKDVDKFLNSFPRKRGGECVYKNYPQGKSSVTDYIGHGEYVVYEDDLHNQDWQVTDSLKTILGYNCQQVVCDFRGRHWTVWFTPDIPVSNGPWKLGGLPGLIMEAYDDNHHYHFYIVGVEKKNNLPITWGEPFSKDRKHIKTNRVDFLKAKMFHGRSGLELTNPELSRGNPRILGYDLIERDYK
ncbi:MAG: hypothetical protein BGO34_12615 [Bacteroidia bacterium 44-10]|nr:MAG: hypothetical protein BGO34_12615 [Bacteroidia bacterium 44-10]